jgi:hypothetical protein
VRVIVPVVIVPVVVTVIMTVPAIVVVTVIMTVPAIVVLLRAGHAYELAIGRLARANAEPSRCGSRFWARLAPTRQAGKYPTERSQSCG